MGSEAPINAGHRFANTAEDFEESENWLKAAEAHSKAAEQFEIATKDAKDTEAAHTLKLLSSNHTRKANELNRKAQRLIKAAAKQRMHQMVGSNSNVWSGNSGYSSSNGSSAGLRHALPSQQQQQSKGSMVSRLAGIYSDDYKISEIGESYALLTNENQDTPFHRFLISVNELVDKVCNPAVAFTSAPLNEYDNPILGSEVLPEEPKNMMDSYFIVNSPDNLDDSQVTNLQKQLDKLSIEASADESNFTKENERLQKQITQMQKRLKSLQVSAEENNMLKSSVLQFRDDVHKQAKKIMQSHHESSLRSSANIITNGGSMIHGSMRHQALVGGSDLMSRLKELEDENKQLRLQNEKQKVLVNRYKERWEMIKENAKKRRPPPSTTTTSAITEEEEQL